MPEDTETDSAPQGLGKGGWNTLFVGVLSGIVLAVGAGALAGDAAPASALRSNIVFRVEVALVVALAWYWASAALWLSWHRTLFQRMGFGNTGLEPPEKKQAVAERDEKVNDFMDETTEALKSLANRLEALEENRDSSR